MCASRYASFFMYTTLFLAFSPVLPVDFPFIFQVPHATFLLTHACFLFYHMTSNITLRILRHSTANLPVSLRWLFEAAWILALAYFIAYLETLVIANVCSSVYFSHKNIGFFRAYLNTPCSFFHHLKLLNFHLLACLYW